MKAFKKWLKEQLSLIQPACVEVMENEMMEKTWRAALEEVQKQINGFNTNFVGDIENWINEELES